MTQIPDPSNFLMTELQAALELLRNGNIAEAQAQLAKIDHPMAQDWLRQLAEMVPTAPPQNPAAVSEAARIDAMFTLPEDNRPPTPVKTAPITPVKSGVVSSVIPTACEKCKRTIGPDLLNCRETNCPFGATTLSGSQFFMDRLSAGIIGAETWMGVGAVVVIFFCLLLVEPRLFMPLLVIGIVAGGIGASATKVNTRFHRETGAAYREVKLLSQLLFSFKTYGSQPIPTTLAAPALIYPPSAAAVTTAIPNPAVPLLGPNAHAIYSWQTVLYQLWLNGVLEIHQLTIEPNMFGTPQPKQEKYLVAPGPNALDATLGGEFEKRIVAGLQEWLKIDAAKYRILKPYQRYPTVEELVYTVYGTKHRDPIYWVAQLQRYEIVQRHIGKYVGVGQSQVQMPPSTALDVLNTDGKAILHTYQDLMRHNPALAALMISDIQKAMKRRTISTSD